MLFKERNNKPCDYYFKDRVYSVFNVPKMYPNLLLCRCDIYVLKLTKEGEKFTVKEQMRAVILGCGC